MSALLDTIIKATKNSNKIAFLFALLLFTKVMGFMPFNIPSAVIYGSMIVMALKCLKECEKIEFLFLMFIFYIAVV